MPSNSLMNTNSPHPSPNMTFSGAVLTGGKSLRMGRNKAGLMVDGQPLLDLQFGRLRAAGASELLLSIAADSVDSETQSTPEIRRVTDLRPGVGPIAGLEAILAAVSNGHVMVLAVDLPALDIPFLRTLRAGLRPGRGRVPRLGARWEPLCAVYPREVSRAGVALQVAAGSWALQDLVHRGVTEGWLESWEVPAALSDRLVNWNRPGDWLARQGHPPRPEI